MSHTDVQLWRVGGIGPLTGWDFYEGNKSKLLRQGALVLSLIVQAYSYKILQLFLLLLLLAFASTLMQIVLIVSSQSVYIIKFILSPLYSLLTFTNWCCLFPF